MLHKVACPRQVTYALLVVFFRRDTLLMFFGESVWQCLQVIQTWSQIVHLGPHI